jgi:hypothetical protein
MEDGNAGKTRDEGLRELEGASRDEDPRRNFL